MTVLDGTEMAKIRNGQFFWFEAQPGSYALSSTCKKTAARFTAEPGRSYYFAVQTDTQCAGMTALLIPFSVFPVDASFGAEAVRQLQMVAPKDALSTIVHVR